MSDKQLTADIKLKYGVERAKLWPACEKHHLVIQPACLICKRKTHLNVHHKFPYHFVILLGRPDLELDERNLFTICVEKTDQHHLLVGHLGYYESYNPELEKFIALTQGLLSSQIRSMKEWITAVTVRPKAFSDMTEDEKTALRGEIDALMPPKAA